MIMFVFGLWGLLLLLFCFIVCWVGDYFINFHNIFYVLIVLCFPFSYCIPPVFNHFYLC